MDYRFDYSKEKDAVIRKERRIGFRDIIVAIEKGDLLGNIDHFNKIKYPKQRIFVVKIGDRVYSVPYVLDKVKRVAFLKTIYPNRKLRKKYLT